MIDDRTADCSALPDGLYVYQNIRTVGHRALYASRHIELLDRAACEILGRTAAIDARTLEQRISQLLRRSDYPADMPSFVTLRQYLTGETMLIAQEIYPYATLSMRAIFPAGVIVDYDPPFEGMPSSLSEGMTEAARVKALIAEKYDIPPVVLRRNADGEIVTADDSPLFALVDDMLCSSSATPPSVEFETALRAISDAGVRFCSRRVDRETIAAADELFYADHRGITALKSVCGRPYMHIIAERIGRYIDQIPF